MDGLAPWKAALWIGLGGATGALARYYMGLWLSRWLGNAWPWATLLINLSGSLLLGLLAGWGAARGALPPELRANIMIGFLGAYTTFSTFSLEGVSLFRESSSPLPALVYLLTSVTLGLTLAWLGFRLGPLFIR